MASNLSKVPLTLRAIQTRSYASAVPVGGLSNYGVKTSKLENGVVVASADNQSSITRVSIIFKAGSRYETPDNMGVTHVLRNAAGLTTKNASQFAITRNIQQVGAGLTCTADRESVAYTLEGTRQAVEAVIPFLTEVATQQTFRPWELSDNVHRLKLELATRPPQQRAVDLLHKAAYRYGLGNSIYISKHQIGKINSETLQHYVSNNFTGGRAAVVGLGVDHHTLSDYAKGLKLPSGEAGTKPSPYSGGEIRSDKGGDYAFVALGLPTCGFTEMSDDIAYSVLKRALGDGSAIKRGNNAGSILGKAVGSGDFAVSALNVSYSDGGLFGILIGAHYKESKRVLKSCIDLLKSGSISSEDVARGKNQLKMYVLSKAESGRGSVESIGKQALFNGEVENTNDIISEIESISEKDISVALDKLSSARLSIAAVGNLTNVPFLDEL